MSNAPWLRSRQSQQQLANPRAALAAPAPDSRASKSRTTTRRITSAASAIGIAPFFVLLFVFSILVPAHFFFGPVVIHSYRVVLLAAFVPCFILWISGNAGKIRTPDILLILFIVWAGISLVVAHGASGAIEPTGVLLVETVGAYLVARVFVRNPATFRAMAQLLFVVVLILLPFSLFEAVTGRSLILEVLRPFLNVHVKTVTDMRWNLFRVQSVFSHPIHYGVFCASVFALTFYVVSYRRSFLRRAIQTGIVGLGTALSLSTGAFVAVFAQAGLIGWDLALQSVRRRWALLGWLTVAAYVLVDLISNRTPFHVFITYLTFNVGSSYNRILIWNFGTAEVFRNPLFGIGFNDWQRPVWMGASMDNFWLVIAVRHGLPALLFFAGAIAIIIYRLAYLKFRDPEVASYRSGLLVTLGGLIIAGATVHYWNHIYALFMFLVGSGVWMLDHREAAEERSFRPVSTRTSQAN